MFTLEDRNNFHDEFEANLSTTIKENKLIDQDLEALAASLDDFIYYTRSTVLNSVLSALPVGVPHPSPNVRTTITDTVDQKPFVSVVISSQKKSPVKFSFRQTFAGNTLNPSNIVEFFAKSVRRAVDLLMQSDNLVAVNEFYARAAVEAELPFSISVVAPGQGVKNTFVDHISDDEVVFVADEDAVFNRLTEMRVFDDEGTTPEGRAAALRIAQGIAPEAVAEGEEVVEVVPTDADNHRVAVEKLATDDLRGLTSPVDLLRSRNSILRIIAGISTHTPTTMIRGSEKRKITGVTKGIKKDISAVVETPDVIGIVERVDGQWKVQLSAYDKKTYEPSDFDLVAEAERVAS